MRTSHEMNTRASSTFVPRFQRCRYRRNTSTLSERLLNKFKSQGKSKGWTFLLEIPGNLFLLPHLRAAAFCRWDQTDRLLFVLFDETGSEIVVFSDHDAPSTAKRLAISYSNMLWHLDAKTASPLH